MTYTDKVQAAYYKVLSMAFTRDEWIRHVRNRLAGALGEYAKSRYAKLINFPFDWEPEVQSLIAKVQQMFDPTKTKLKSSSNISKMFREALMEASGEQLQITYAKNNFIRDYIKKEDVISFLKTAQQANFKAETLLLEMLQEFAPELLDYLTNNKRFPK